MTPELPVQQALLHNMSMRSRTRITATVSVVGRAVARFSVGRGALRALLDDPALAGRLDEHWSELHLHGALHVYPLPAAGTIGDAQVVAAGRLLALNVLARARGGLLLPGAPLDLEPAQLARSLASDDPRLVALAAAGRSTR